MYFVKTSLLAARTRPVSIGRLCLLFVAALAYPMASNAQGDTEIYLLPLNQEGNSLHFGTPENVSQNPGYDNQPSFIPGKDILLYARTRNGQTDIATYDPATDHTGWVTDTPGGSEYSPQWIPGTETISAIRLDTTGLQRLYAYTLTGEARLIFDDLKIGYTAWAGPEVVICTVLREEGMDLVNAKPTSQKFRIMDEGVGRSLHRIPASRLISYTASGEKGMRVVTIDPYSPSLVEVSTLPEGVQDLCWLPDGSLLCGGDGVLRRQMPGSGAEWEIVHHFEPGFGKVSRLAVNEAGTLLALVVETNNTP